MSLRTRGMAAALVAGSIVVACRGTPSDPADSPGARAPREADVSSIEDVVTLAKEAGFPRVMVLAVGAPTHASWQVVDGDVLFETTYVVDGWGGVAVIQTSGRPLPEEGAAILFRGSDAERTEGTVYWEEDGYVLAIAGVPLDVAELEPDLRWEPTG